MKILKIFELLLKLWHTIFPREKKIVSTKDENLHTLKSALETLDQTEEVVAAKKTVDYIETLPAKEREQKADKLAEVQEIVEKNVSAQPIEDKRAKSLIDRYRRGS